MVEGAACTNATPAHALGRVLRPDEFFARATYGDATPAGDLADWVERYWSVEWDLAAGESFPVATVEDLTVNLTLERGGCRRPGATGEGAWLTGPGARGRFPVTLTGAGSVVGIKLHPGAITRFADVEPEDIRDTTLRAHRWFPTIDADWATLPTSAGEAAPALDAWLRARRPAPDAAYDRFREVLAMLDDPAITRLDHLADRAACDVRTLQRMFRRYAGIGPKAVLARARVIDAVAALDRGWDGTLADLAHELGWADQAHFSRDFRRVIGEPPTAYLTRRATRIAP